MVQVAIVDFYVDEPSCLGVPPYVSPYVRYAAGALVDGRAVPEKHIDYITVDAWRGAGKELSGDYELVLIIAGTTVPGRYLGGKIGTYSEVLELLRYRQKYQPGGITLLGGPIRHCSPQLQREIAELGGALVHGDLEIYAHELIRDPGGIRNAARRLGLLTPEPSIALDRCHTAEQLDRFATAGAFVTTLHPGFPYLVMELETYRGCTRTPHCSFCTEALYGPPSFRAQKAVASEVAELYRMGNRYFRLGRQADLLTYLPHSEQVIRGFPRPNPESLRLLYSKIHEAAPDLKVLHMDNMNPGAVAAHPDHSAGVIAIIAGGNTTGDTAAMGIETVEIESIKMNNLKATPEQVFEAVRIVNESGGFRKDGIPALLPGLNFLQGLPGETERTFEKNFRFLQEILDSGLLLRRINIRRVHEYSGTELVPASKLTDDAINPHKSRHRGRSKKGKLENRFQYYKDLIRKEIDRPMLEKIYPAGTVLKEIICEAIHNEYILGRQLGSYPITLKFPPGDRAAREALASGEPIQAVVTSHEERSLHALSLPIAINELPSIALKHFPGLGKRRVYRLMEERPLRSMDHLRSILEGDAFCQESLIDFNEEAGSQNSTLYPADTQ